MTRDSFSLKGKVSIVTGASRGIGKAIALAFARAGADVAVCSRSLEDGSLASTAKEIQALGRHTLALPCDISHKPDVDNMVEKVVKEFGRVDILVNNAGNYYRGPLLTTSEQDWDRIIDTHLKGCFFCCQAVGARMVAQKSGAIINIASGTTQKALPETGLYSLAKVGVIQLTKTLAVELGPFNIRVNGINPGLTQTKLLDGWFSEENFKMAATQVPLRRISVPEDMTGAAVFLASEAASFVTGHIITVDGGRFL